MEATRFNALNITLNEGAILSTITPLLAEHLKMLEERWEDYLKESSAVYFAEFALMLDRLAELCKEDKMPGLARLCEGVTNQMQALSADASDHPLVPADMSALVRQVDTMLAAARTFQFRKAEERRAATASDDADASGAGKPRSIWLTADGSHPWVSGLTEQLTFFGFRVHRFNWHDIASEEVPPLVILFIPPDDYGVDEIDCIRNVRALHPASRIFCLAVPELLDPMVTLLRAGADVTIPAVQQTATVLANVLNLIESQDQEPYRVLAVEDSPTAIALIQRTLSQHGIDNYAISNPDQLLDAVWRYRPDLVLMDMHMPHCTGVEATRVLRQIPACQALPVVYLSSETNMEMQVAALRLGGDQFINKPFNPVLMTTIIKTKIERYREMQRSSQHDGLTGLLNHTASKGRLNQMLHAMDPLKDRLCVAMIDIDHFKSINDAYGHPVGDQVIRNLAWLLKGRLRTSDIIGRYGGEEFLVVLRGACFKYAYDMLDRIRDDFTNLPHAHARGTLNASFSAGLAAYPEFDNDQALIDAADNALLAAKSHGRNRIGCAGAAMTA
ncbi:MAG: diguanylate cyclase response regulator [Herminiimonas sp.]|nr:diguanylate cyclase response regulator [Herminiimonas sp.]